jgi:hypothetical protein
VYGTFTTLDTLAAGTTQTVVAFGEDRAFDAIEAAANVHNAQMNELLAGFVERSTDRLRRYGGAASMAMDELDQFGTPDAQKVTAGSNVAFPLKRYGLAVQWTRMAFLTMLASELAAQFTAALDADRNAIIREIKRALFTPTNTTFTDRFVDNVDLGVKALVNADSAPLPLGPNGEVFNGATHTHYLGTAAFVAADLTALITTVIEHYGAGEVMVYLNQAQEAAVRAFTGFTAYVDPRIILASTSQGAVGALDVINIYNRKIGIFGGAEIWIKPWMPANYAFAWVRGQAVPLVMRVRDDVNGNFGVLFDDESHPLRARGVGREFGVGVWQRINGAILQTNGATYATPPGL